MKEGWVPSKILPDFLLLFLLYYRSYLYSLGHDLPSHLGTSQSVLFINYCGCLIAYLIFVRKYEDLNRHLNDGKLEANEDTLKELEKLEKELSNKEDEIAMVMDLYKEVAVLKEQVKTLKEKASQGSVAVQQNYAPSKHREAREYTAVHLTKLLRQIQYYQGLYKS